MKTPPVISKEAEIQKLKLSIAHIAIASDLAGQCEDNAVFHRPEWSRDIVYEGINDYFVKAANGVFDLLEPLTGKPRGDTFVEMQNRLHNNPGADYGELKFVYRGLLACFDSEVQTP